MLVGTGTFACLRLLFHGGGEWFVLGESMKVGWLHVCMGIFVASTVDDNDDGRCCFGRDDRWNRQCWKPADHSHA